MKTATLLSDEVISKIERIGSHIYEDFRNGLIDFETMDASLATLANATDGQVWLAAPERE